MVAHSGRFHLFQDLAFLNKRVPVLIFHDTYFKKHFNIIGQLYSYIAIIKNGVRMETKYICSHIVIFFKLTNCFNIHHQNDVRF